jgi:ABC-type nitrate/sulfonate/bicarbonate transport system substrate-binding protein
MTVAVLFLSACSSGGGSGGGSGKSGVTTLNIGIAAPVALYSLPAIADAEHLWPSNVQVHWTIMNGATVLSSIATGKIQMALGSAPQYDAAAYQSRTPNAWIADIQAPADFQMIVRPGINSVSGLRGKVVAITSPGSSTQYLSQDALAKAGLKSSDYQLSPLGSTPTMVSAFAGGTAQAIVLPSSVVQPLLSQVKGSKVVYDFYAEKVPWIGGGVVAYTPWTKQNPAATVSVLKGLNAALQFLHAHPKTAEPVVTKFAPSKTPDLQLQYLLQRTPSRVQPVNLQTLESMYSTMRAANGGKGPDDAFAKTFYDNAYVDQAVK